MASMMAIVATLLGGPEVLELRSVPLPWPRGAQDALVRLQAGRELARQAGALQAGQIVSFAS